jgi:hypothetical protein
MAQWAFVGPAYTAANPGQDNQALINWYVEYDANEPSPQQPAVNVAEAKVALGLLGAPGLIALNSAYSGEVRGCWTLPGGTKALFVVGANVLLVTASAKGSATVSSVGTMLSSSGHVNIRDNGSGHIAVIVDGTTNLYVFHTDTNAFATYTSAAYLGATNVAEMDGWLIFNKPASQTFFTSPVYWNGTDAFDGTYFALADNGPDNLVTIIENNRELWLIGEAHTEPWYNAGGPSFPFSRIEGAMMQIGCAAANSVARTGHGLIWLARSERGSLSVIKTQGYQFDPISTPALSYALNQYATVSDAIGYVYSEDGHEFYVLILPTADVTWVYDITTGQWHQRASFDPVIGLFHRQRVNCLCTLAGMQVGGDYTNGRIYWQTRTAYADDQYPLVAVRRASHVWDKNDRNRVVNSRLQIDFFPGVGNVVDPGSDPQAMLRWSNDGGQTWGNEHWTGIGKVGETTRRAIWRRLGAARDRVYEVRISDPVKRDIAGASLQAGATNA